MNSGSIRGGVAELVFYIGMGGDCSHFANNESHDG